MGFKNFRLTVTIRLLLLVATICLLFYLIWFTELYASSAVVMIGVGLQIWGLIHYIDRTNRDLARFLLSIRHSDFSAGFPDNKLGGSHQELRQVFQEVLKDFRKTRSDKQEQANYLQTVMQHVGVGLLAVCPDESIDFINNAAKRLLGVSVARNLDNLRPLGPELIDTLTTLQPGEKKLLKLEVHGDLLQLSLAATEFRSGRRVVKLVSLQNIANELAQREMEAWQQLVRVLTHEIMNSVTPIISLASTARQMREIENENKSGQPDDLHEAVATIERRSEGLLHFVDAYRSLTRIPKPEYQQVRVADLLGRVKRLAEIHPEAGNISFSLTVEPPGLDTTLDPDLIEQVLINLTTNAIQALHATPDGRIDLMTSMDNRGRVVITVQDNGPGIPHDSLESIFIPFYTTKPKGTGVGLSLSRQIMRLHRGAISVSSAPGEPTRFFLRI